jgi:hypothetical protein
MWDVCHGIISSPFYHTLKVELLGVSVWLDLGHRTSHHHPYLWCTGGTTLKYFSRFYAFLGGPLAAMGSDHLPGCWVQPNEPIVLELEVHDRLPER